MRKTLDDYLALPQGMLAELIDGEIHVTPSPFRAHQEAVGALFAALRGWALAKHAGRVYVAPFDVHLPSGDVVEPDVIFVSTARSHILAEWIRGVPDMLAEVLSPADARRDRVLKRDLYAQNGVPQYWLVDPAERAIDVLCLDRRGAYRLEGRYAAGQTLVTPALPGFSLPVDSVFS